MNVQQFRKTLVANAYITILYCLKLWHMRLIFCSDFSHRPLNKISEYTWLVLIIWGFTSIYNMWLGLRKPSTTHNTHLFVLWDLFPVLHNYEKSESFIKFLINFYILYVYYDTFATILIKDKMLLCFRLSEVGQILFVDKTGFLRHSHIHIWCQQWILMVAVDACEADTAY